MTPVDQEFLHSEEVNGDCLRACTASLLGLPRDEVPHFVQENPGDRWFFAWEDWLSQRGWQLVFIGEPLHFEDVFYIASGPTERGTIHVVIMKDGKLVHDPHPSRAGLTAVTITYFLVPKDAAAWRPAA